MFARIYKLHIKYGSANPLDKTVDFYNYFTTNMSYANMLKCEHMKINGKTSPQY